MSDTIDQPRHSHAARARRPAEQRPMRVLVLAASYAPLMGGGEAHARSLNAAMVERGVKTLVVTSRRPAGTKAHEQLEGAEVYRVPFSGHRRWGKFTMMLPAALRMVLLARRYDVVYVCGLRTLGVVGVGVGRLLGKPCVIRSESCTELSGEFNQNATGTFVRRVHGRAMGAALGLRNAVLRRATRLVAISRAIREEYLAEGVDDARIVDIPNGIDTGRFRPASPAERDAIRQRLGLNGKRVVVYTGKLNHGKGLMSLLRAWEPIAADYADGHLLLVGPGTDQFLSCEAELRRFVEDHQLNGSVTFTGGVTDVEQYLRAADLFAFPSESEALGLSLIEAMACGLPAVACGVGGILDIIQRPSEGILVPPRDDRQLGAAIRRLLDEPELAARLARDGRAAVVETFCIHRVAEQHIDLFASLVKRPAPADEG